MPLRTLHNTFTQGELDPTLFARIDLDLYTKGARKLRNMFSLWTGAASIAPGTDFIYTMVDRTNSNAPILDPASLNGLDFQFSIADDIIYTLIFRPDTASTVAIDVFEFGVRVTSVGASMYTVAQIKDLHFAIGQDRILILHPDVQTYQFIRAGTSVNWNLFPLNPAVNAVYDYTLLGGTQYRVTGFTFTPTATTGTTTLTASSSIFTANHVGGLYVGGGGIARITAVASGTSASITVLDDFTSTAAIPGVLSSLNEVMWTSGGGSPAGADRGWPSRGCFYLNRLILGASKSIPNVAALSVAGVYDNFDDSEDDAFAGFSASFNGKGNQTIQAIVADDSIIFLTSNKIFAQNPLVDTPISVGNFYFAPQSQDPCGTIEPVTLDNQVLHVSGNYSQVMQVAYATADAKYKAFPIGLLSAQLFQTINTNASWEPKNIKAKLYFATQENGSMLMYNTLAEQFVSAWSLRTTTGKFRRVIGDGPQTHVIVEREINTGSDYENAIDYGLLTNNLFTAFNNVSTEFHDGTAVELFGNPFDYILIGNQSPFTSILFSFGTVASGNLAPTFEYLDGNGNWNFFSPIDGTSGFTADGNITWSFSDVSDWKSYKLVQGGDNPIFWIRVRRNAGDSVEVLPITDAIVRINTGNRLHLEKQNFDRYTDCTVTTSSNSSGTVTGLVNLAGQQVYARSNGASYGPYFVQSDGSVNIGHEFESVEIGMQYVPLLIPMPIYAPTQEGDNTYQQKYVEDLYIDYVDSLYLQAGTNDSLTDIPILPLGAYTLGVSVPPVTGTYLIHPRGNWNPRQEIIVTQSLPGPMTVIGIGYTVELT